MYCLTALLRRREDRVGAVPVRPSAERPAGTGATASLPTGYLHCGPSGAGHFVKMVHNAVEYGMMAAMAEGLSVINSVSRSPIRGRQLHDGPVKLHRAPGKAVPRRAAAQPRNRHRNQRSDNPSHAAPKGWRRR